MKFHGVVESITRLRISGWAYFSQGGKKHFPSVIAEFSDGTKLQTTSASTRSDIGEFGFSFAVPEHLEALPYPDFLSKFRACYAVSNDGKITVEIPLFKSIAIHKEVQRDNPTILDIPVIRDYQSNEHIPGKIACLTVAHNEHLMLPLWERYYGERFGYQNLFIIDHGSSPSLKNCMHAMSNVLCLPRSNFDNWLIVRIVSLLHRFLLESYEKVLYVDSDEFIVVPESIAKPHDMQEFLLSLSPSVVTSKGYDLYHDIMQENAYNTFLPILKQRRFLERNSFMDKPFLSRRPLNCIPGFHKAKEGGVHVPGLFLLHLRWFDLRCCSRCRDHCRATQKTWRPTAAG